MSGSSRTPTSRLNDNGAGRGGDYGAAPVIEISVSHLRGAVQHCHQNHAGRRHNLQLHDTKISSLESTKAFGGIAVRFLLVAIFMLFTNSVFAQVPQPAVPVAPAQPDALPKETPAAEGKLVLTPEQLKAHEANIKKCVSNYQPISNKVRLLVRIGPDGMIEASEALSPIDSEEFRQDVQSATKAIHQCEPFNIEPLYKTIGKRFSQEVVFMPKQFDNETRRALNQYLRCVKEYETGPMVRVEIKLNADGTFAERPHLLNQTET